MRTIGLRSDHAPDQIPASHHDLAECPPVAALTTVTPQGYPQTSVEPPRDSTLLANSGCR
jgi:hypothetical protein